LNANHPRPQTLKAPTQSKPAFYPQFLLSLKFNPNPKLKFNLTHTKKSKFQGLRSERNKRLKHLINEEASLFAKYLRNEKEAWNPRIAIQAGAITKLILK